MTPHNMSKKYNNNTTQDSVAWSYHHALAPSFILRPDDRSERASADLDVKGWVVLPVLTVLTVLSGNIVIVAVAGRACSCSCSGVREKKDAIGSGGTILYRTAKVSLAASCSGSGECFLFSDRLIVVLGMFCLIM